MHPDEEKEDEEQNEEQEMQGDAADDHRHPLLAG